MAPTSGSDNLDVFFAVLELCIFIQAFLGGAGPAYLVYFVLYRRECWAALVLLVLCALPSPAINFAYNMSHGGEVWQDANWQKENFNASMIGAGSTVTVYFCAT